MRKNKFGLFMAAMFFIVTAIISGGCGGSNSSLTQKGSSPAEVIANLSSMDDRDIRETPEYYAMVDELVDNGTWAKVEKLNYYNVMEYLTDEELAEIIREIPEESREQFIVETKLNNEELKRHFFSGDVLTLFRPTKELIARTKSFLSDLESSTDELDISGKIEIAAVVLRTAEGKEVIGEYRDTKDHVELNNVLTYIVPDIRDMMSADEETDMSELENSYLELQIERWRRYYTWLANLDEIEEQQTTEEANITASSAQENNITQISSVYSRTYDGSYTSVRPDGYTCLDGDFPYERLLTMNTITWLIARTTLLQYGMTRTNTMDTKVYAVHSFTDHCDYYFVKSGLYTKPLKVTVQDSTGTLNVAYSHGYTKSFEPRASIVIANQTAGKPVQVNMTNIEGGQSDVNLYEKFAFDLEGIFSGNSFGVFDGISYSENLNYYTGAANLQPAWTFSNLQSEEYAGIRGELPVPEKSDNGKFVPVSAATTEQEVPFYFLWKVEESDWRKMDNNAVKISFDVNINEGITLDTCIFLSQRYAKTDLEANKKFHFDVLVPNAPKHSTVHQRDFAFNKDGGMIHARIRVFSETEWDLELVLQNDAELNWVVLDKTHGDPTGPEGEWVHFSVPENHTDHNRFAKIYLVTYPYDDKTIKESTMVDVFQSNNESFSNE